MVGPENNGHSATSKASCTISSTSTTKTVTPTTMVSMSSSQSWIPANAMKQMASSPVTMNVSPNPRSATGGLE